MLSEAVPRSVVVDQMQPAQFLDSGVEDSGVGFTGAQERPEGERATVAQLPEHSQSTAAPQGVEQHQKGTARRAAARWSTYPEFAHATNSIAKADTLSHMKRSTSHSVARMATAVSPLPEDVQTAIHAVMRGRPPLTLFTTLARDRRLFWKYFSGGLLDKGHLTPRHREIVIDRTTALCGAEFEWGIHVTGFAAWAGLTGQQITSTVYGTARDSCWEDEADRTLIDLCDALHQSATVNEALWLRLRATQTDEAILELLLLAGFYRTTSYLVNALSLPLEEGMVRFEDYAVSSSPAES